MLKQEPYAIITIFRAIGKVPKGNRYAFSIMVNHFTAPTAEIRKGISTLLNRIQKKLK
jgi:hypothetical protein